MATSTSPHINIKAPRLRNDSNLKIFFEQLENYFATSAVVDDNMKIAIFKAGLSGPDYEAYCLDQTLPTTFADMKQHLLRLHQPADQPVILKRRFGEAVQLPHESTLVFANRLLSLSTRCYPTMTDPDREGLVRDRLLRGLAAQRLRDEVLLNEGMSFNDLLTHLTKMELVVRQSEVNTVEREDRIDALTGTVDKLAEQLAALTSAVGQNQQR